MFNLYKKKKNCFIKRFVLSISIINLNYFQTLHSRLGITFLAKSVLLFDHTIFYLYI